MTKTPMTNEQSSNPLPAVNDRCRGVAELRVAPIHPAGRRREQGGGCFVPTDLRDAETRIATM
jgi:hypothetical protein